MIFCCPLASRQCKSTFSGESDGWSSCADTKSPRASARNPSSRDGAVDHPGRNNRPAFHFGCIRRQDAFRPSGKSCIRHRSLVRGNLIGRSRQLPSSWEAPPALSDALSAKWTSQQINWGSDSMSKCTRTVFRQCPPPLESKPARFLEIKSLLHQWLHARARNRCCQLYPIPNTHRDELYV